jgi:hypothetical protein
MFATVTSPATATWHFRLRFG